MKIAVGSDHCGYIMKQLLIPMLKKNNEVNDFGCYSSEVVDFPDIAQMVTNAINTGQAERGIMFCSTGIGAAIACNKVKGIRAGVCHDTYSAHQSVEHDNIQVLVIGAEIIGYHAACEIINAFLHAKFSGDEAFNRRLKKIENIEESKD